MQDHTHGTAGGLWGPHCVSGAYSLCSKIQIILAFREVNFLNFDQLYINNNNSYNT
jgi:hypothetical protein